MDTKQVIVMRKDLNMRKGKMIAQGAHASIAWILNRLATGGERGSRLSPEEHHWAFSFQKKIVVYVESEDMLHQIYDKAKQAHLTVNMIMDAGLTEFKGVATLTCLAIGPNKSEEVDKITGGLPLL